MRACPSPCRRADRCRALLPACVVREGVSEQGSTESDERVDTWTHREALAPKATAVLLGCPLLLTRTYCNMCDGDC